MRNPNLFIYGPTNLNWNDQEAVEKACWSLLLVEGDGTHDRYVVENGGWFLQEVVPGQPHLLRMADEHKNHFLEDGPIHVECYLAVVPSIPHHMRPGDWQNPHWGRGAGYYVDSYNAILAAAKARLMSGERYQDPETLEQEFQYVISHSRREDDRDADHLASAYAGFDYAHRVGASVR